MAKPPENSVTWGTLEELLLACAVNRYGNNCWDSVAKEIQKRNSTFHLLTPQKCKQRYHDLKRRFATQNGGGSVHAPPIESEDAATADSVLWLEELRRLRIAELKRELQRYDDSIVSLQLKVKKLKEERELSLKENQREELDLEKKNQEREKEEDDKEKKEKENLPESSSPDFGPVVGVSGGESDRENQSVNESNSSDSKSGSLDDRVGGTKKEPAVPVSVQPDPLEGTEKPASEASCDGSSDTISPSKKSVASQYCNSGEGDSVKERVDSLGLRESVAGSKSEGGEEGTKESSDVQSSASMSRKLGGEKGVSGCNSGGGEPEAENQSVSVKSSNGKPQPLIDFIELIRSHKLGWMFERRLESQETTNYKNLIRQQVDLQTIRRRLDEGHYSDCHAKFYRDVLLLLTNAAVYFAKKSSEHKAAVELRQIITKRLPHIPGSKKDPAAAPLWPPQPKRESEPAADSFLLKPKLSGGPVIACRKRSSIVAKSSAGGGERKKDTTALSRNDEKEKEKEKEKGKASVDVKPSEKSSFSAVTKKRTRDQRIIASSKNSSGSNNNNSKSRTKNPSNKNSDGSGNENSSEAKSETKKNSSSNAASNAGNVKKQSVANFLNRMRRSSSSSNNGSLLDSLKNSGASAESSKGTERKRRGGGGVAAGGGKSAGVKDQNTSRKASASKPVKEKEKAKEKEARERGSAVARKSAGRLPKRAAAAAAAAVAVVGKKRREGGGEFEAAVPKKRARK